MKGQILHIDDSTGAGVISGADGRRYDFGASDLYGNGQVAVAGVAVDFDIQQDRAVRIFPDPGMPVQARPAGEKNKMVAGLLALFLGALGIHKFYIGANGAGLVMLACSLLGWILLFIPNLIIGLIAFIEAIIYMTRTDEQFYRSYELGKKSWF